MNNDRTPVLRCVNMSNNSAKPLASTTSPVPSGEQNGELNGITGRIRVVRRQLDGLFTGYSPAFGARVNEILDHSPPTDVAMLEAWSRIGHGDAARGPRIDLIRANEATMSPLGVACLINYARGYLDELEAVQAATLAVALPTRSRTSEPTSERSDCVQNPSTQPKRGTCPSRVRTRPAPTTPASQVQ